MRLGLRHAMPAVEHTIDAPASAVWDVITDLEAWPVWGPSVSGAQLDSPGPFGVDSRGKVWTPVGIPLPFRITEFDEGRVWAWRVAGVPATRHEVIPQGEHRCVLSFGVPLWAPAYLGVMALAVPRIAKLAVARA